MIMRSYLSTEDWIAGDAVIYGIDEMGDSCGLSNEQISEIKNIVEGSDKVLIPVQAAYLPVKGLQQLIKTIGMIKRSLNPGLEIAGLLSFLRDRLLGR